MEEDYIILHKQDPTLPKIKLFLLFMKGDSRIPDAFNWSLSIDAKIKAMNVLFKEVLEQIPRCFEEMDEMNKKGYGQGLELNKLALKYENFLNSIYSLCENLSRVIAYLYRDKNLPQGFFDQKHKFLRQDFDSDYTNILKNTNWCDEVHAIRTEATHYLSGLITISKATELGYLNKPKSRRKGVPGNISIDDIKTHVNQIYDDVFAFLFAFGDHFIKIINQNSGVTLPCLRTSSGLIGTKIITLSEYLNNEPGICGGFGFDCPIKSSCRARPA